MGGQDYLDGSDVLIQKMCCWSDGFGVWVSFSYEMIDVGMWIVVLMG